MVVCPAFYAAAIFSLAIAAVMMLVTWLAAGRDLGRQGMLILLASDLPFLLVSAGLATTGAGAVLDHRTGMLEVRSRVFGFPSGQATVPLSSVEEASIQTGKQTHRLVFRLKNGSRIPLGFFTNQPGHVAAARAINDFLQSGPAAAQP